MDFDIAYDWLTAPFPKTTTLRHPLAVVFNRENYFVSPVATQWYLVIMILFIVFYGALTICFHALVGVYTNMWRIRKN